MNNTVYQLVLLRHGSTDWNLTDRFTGWADVHLSDVGIKQARAAGKQLSDKGFKFDETHVSVLRRTRQTAQEVLAGAQHPETPFYESWRLNERHYGRLQGMNKQEIFQSWGEKRSRRWWRGYNDPPPLLDHDDPRHPRFDQRYNDLDPSLLPLSESLSQCQERLLPYWHDVMLPKIKGGKRLLVVSHGNTLRSLRMHVEKLSPQEIEHVEVPSGVPMVYHFDQQCEPLKVEWLAL